MFIDYFFILKFRLKIKRNNRSPIHTKMEEYPNFSFGHKQL